MARLGVVVCFFRGCDLRIVNGNDPGATHWHWHCPRCGWEEWTRARRLPGDRW